MQKTVSLDVIYATLLFVVSADLWNDEVEFPTKPPKGYHVGPVPVSQGLVGSSRSSNNGGSYGGHSHSMMEAVSKCRAMARSHQNDS